MIWWWEPENAGVATSRPWGWPSNLLHQGGQYMQHPPHQAPPLQHAGNMVVMGNHLLGALCQGCHGCLCDFPSYQPLPISEEMDKLASMVKSQERSVCAQGFAVPDNWITGARNQWTRDYSLLSLWSTTSADLLSILLQTSSPRGNEAV